MSIGSLCSMDSVCNYSATQYLMSPCCFYANEIISSSNLHASCGFKCHEPV